MDAQNSNSKRLTAAEVLRRYKDEDLPALCEVELQDVNQVGNFGERPLHVAASRGIIEEIVALVEGGAEVNARGEFGNTPLHEAVEQGHIAAIQFLLEHGASVSVKNEFEQTVMDITETSEAIKNALKRHLAEASESQPRPGSTVVLTHLPPGFLDDLPLEDQTAIREVLGRPVRLNEYEDDGRVEIEFTDRAGVTHLIYVTPEHIRPSHE